jgi:hypothetical protein
MLARDLTFCPRCGHDREAVHRLVRDLGNVAWQARDGDHNAWLAFVRALDHLRDALEV